MTVSDNTISGHQLFDASIVYRAPDRRWTLICCYNAARNNPYREHHHPRYTPLAKVPDAAVRQAGLKFSDEAHKAAFLKRATDPAELTKRGSATYSSGAR